MFRFSKPLHLAAIKGTMYQSRLQWQCIQFFKLLLFASFCPTELLSYGHWILVWLVKDSEVNNSQQKGKNLTLCPPITWCYATVCLFYWRADARHTQQVLVTQHRQLIVNNHASLTLLQTPKCDQVENENGYWNQSYTFLVCLFCDLCYWWHHQQWHFSPRIVWKKG